MIIIIWVLSWWQKSLEYSCDFADFVSQWIHYSMHDVYVENYQILKTYFSLGVPCGVLQL